MSRIYFLRPIVSNMNPSKILLHFCIVLLLAIQHLDLPEKERKVWVNSLLVAKNLSNLASVFYKKDTSKESIKNNGLQ